MKGKVIMTVSQAAEKAAWEKLRTTGIGGSDIAAIMGLNPWKSAYTLYAEKHGDVEPEDISDKECVYWGVKLEQAVAERFCELTGKKVRRCGMLQDDNCDYFLANADRLVVGEEAGLECKTANGFKAAEWDDDSLPDAYYCQCQWYMMVTGFLRWYIACLIGGQKFVWKEIPRNDDFIVEMRTKAITFWENLKQGIPPVVDGAENTTDTLNTEHSKNYKSTEIGLSVAAAELITRYNDLSETEKMIKEQKKTCQNGLIALLQGNEAGVYGNYKVSNKLTAGRITLDSKALKKDYPDIFAKYSKQGEASCRFTIKEMKGGK